MVLGVTGPVVSTVISWSEVFMHDAVIIQRANNQRKGTQMGFTFTDVGSIRTIIQQIAEYNSQSGQSGVRHSMEVPLRGKPHPALRSHLPLGGEGWDWGSDHRTKGAAIIAAGRVRRDCRPDNPGLVMPGVWWYTGAGMKGRTNRAWKMGIQQGSG